MWFDKRQREPELQDQPDLDSSLLHAALRGLDRCNWWSRTAEVFWQPIRRLSAASPAEPLRILDIACGSGDLLVQLGRPARAHGLEVHLTGCDINPSTVDYARRHCAEAGIAAQFFTFDACKDEIPGGHDVVITSTFLHHLADVQAQSLLARMRTAARRLVMVDDLLRGWSGWLVAHLATRFLLTSWVNRIDGARSVAAAFTLEEIRRLAQNAGLSDATLVKHWPSRFLMCWQRKETVDTATAITPADPAAHGD